jgi:NADPH2 dehydrogenase
MKMKAFEPIQIRNVVFKNRLVMAPMCMYQSNNSGTVQPFHLVHYPTRAYGGVSLVIIEATSVESRGRISVNDLGIWSDKHIEGLHTLVDSVHQAGGLIGIQLAHAGRKANVLDEVIVSPSAIPFSDQYVCPKELSILEIQTIIQAFKEAAIRAKKAGFDIIELHGAHGYLINQFLSPLTNQRADDFGGPLEHRVQFLKQIIQEVRSVWDGPLFVRVSAEEYASGGHHIEESLRVYEQIASLVDVVHVSSGGVVPVSMKPFPGYQVEFASKYQSLGHTAIAGGLITTGEQIEDILSNKQASFVFLGRELLRNPYFPLQLAFKANRKDLIIKPYERGF